MALSLSHDVRAVVRLQLLIAADPVLVIRPHDWRINGCNPCDAASNLDGNVDEYEVSAVTNIAG